MRISDWSLDVCSSDLSASQYEYFKDYFDYYDAEEIKGIEVMTSTRNALAYVQRFLNPLAKITDHIFIEVTTRSGHGPFLKKSIGTYLFKPMAFTMPREFYSTKYKARSIVDMTDIRSTIYWEPFITHDKDGKTTVSFYTADNPVSYSKIIDGIDMPENLGNK